MTAPATAGLGPRIPCEGTELPFPPLQALHAGAPPAPMAQGARVPVAIRLAMACALASEARGGALRRSCIQGVPAYAAPLFGPVAATVGKVSSLIPQTP